MQAQKAKQFAKSWAAAWNSHDVARIMSHYASDIELVSPVAESLLGHAKVCGYAAVSAYFLQGLQAYPDLQFHVRDVLHGVDSLVLYYENQNAVRAGEFMQFDAQGKVCKMVAHYHV